MIDFFNGLASQSIIELSGALIHLIRKSLEWTSKVSIFQVGMGKFNCQGKEIMRLSGKLLKLLVFEWMEGKEIGVVVIVGGFVLRCWKQETSARKNVKQKLYSIKKNNEAYCFNSLWNFLVTFGLWKELENLLKKKE